MITADELEALGFAISGGDETTSVSMLRILAELLFSRGQKDVGNSSDVELGAGGDFVGPWTQNDHAQIGFNLVADQPGTFFVELSPNGGETVTLSKPYDVRAGEPRFDVLVKFPARWHRVRFVNGATPQGEFVPQTVTGSGLFPFAVSERDEPVFAAVRLADVQATTYCCAVQLADRVNWPHADAGRIDLHSANFAFDKVTSSRGAIRVGIITRVDANDADIAFVLGIPFDNSDSLRGSRDREFGTPLKFGQAGGELTKISTSGKRTVAAVNTATPLETGKAGLTVVPAVGDLIVEFEHAGGGAYSGSFSCHYRGVNSTT